MLLASLEGALESLGLSLVLHVLISELNKLTPKGVELQLFTPSLLLHACGHSQGLIQAPFGFEFLSQEPISLVDELRDLRMQEIKSC